MTELKIPIKLDKAGASAEFKAFTAEISTAVRADLKETDAAERAKAAAAKETARAVKAAAKEKADAEKAAYKQAAEAAKAAAKEAAQAQAATEGALTSVLKFTGGMLGMQSVEGVIMKIADHFDKIRQDAFAASEDVLRMRGMLRELAALRGEMGQTGPTMAHVLGISAQTLQTPEEAQQMESTGLGIGELAIGPGGTMKRGEFEKAMIAAGKMQTMEGGPAEAYGSMVGQLALSAEKEMTSEDMQAKLWRMFQIQQPGAFKNFGQAAQQYSKVQSLVQSGVLSPEKAMGGLSTFSLAGPEESATMLDAFVRATMGGRLRERGMKAPEGVEAVKSADYMKSIGADKLIDPMEIGKLIAEDLDKQKTAALGRGEQFDVYGYLQTHGFVEQLARDAVLLYTGMKNRGRLAKIEEAETAPDEEGAIDKRFDDRVSKDLFLQGRAGQISEQLATTKQGMREEPMVAAQRAAFARLKAQGKISGSFAEWQGKSTLGSVTEDLFTGGYNSQVNAETLRGLEAEGKRVGARAPSIFEHGPGGRDYVRKYAENVRDAGGDVTADAMADLKTAASDLKQAAQEFRRKPVIAAPPRPGSRIGE